MSVVIFRSGAEIEALKAVSELPPWRLLLDKARDIFFLDSGVDPSWAATERIPNLTNSGTECFAQLKDRSAELSEVEDWIHRNGADETLFSDYLQYAPQNIAGCLNLSELVRVPVFSGASNDDDLDMACIAYPDGRFKLRMLVYDSDTAVEKDLIFENRRVRVSNLKPPRFPPGTLHQILTEECAEFLDQKLPIFGGDIDDNWGHFDIVSVGGTQKPSRREKAPAPVHIRTTKETRRPYEMEKPRYQPIILIPFFWLANLIRLIIQRLK
ncbi:hypothetical protein ACQKH5_15275 [Hyphomonas sp. NPDC076900]|uniref:hypothetical protein n=1 Tax=unclassified Hyphomonas TaxID=2630699 RepID=UPI003CFC05D6